MSEEKKGIVKTVVDGFKESYQAQEEIDKENLRLEADLVKARHKENTKPNPDFVEFKETKGLGAKIKVVGKHLKNGAQEQRTKDAGAQREIMNKKYDELDALNNKNK